MLLKKAKKTWLTYIWKNELFIFIYNFIYLSTYLLSTVNNIKYHCMKKTGFAIKVCVCSLNVFIQVGKQTNTRRLHSRARSFMCMINVQNCSTYFKMIIKSIYNINNTITHVKNFSFLYVLWIYWMSTQGWHTQYATARLKSNILLKSPHAKSDCLTERICFIFHFFPYLHTNPRLL